MTELSPGRGRTRQSLRCYTMASSWSTCHTSRTTVALVRLWFRVCTRRSWSGNIGTRSVGVLRRHTVPTYQYACTACGHQLEAVQSFADEALSECPACEGRLRKLFS